MSGLERNPLIGIVGPADTMNHCAAVLEVVDRATSYTEEGIDSDQAQGFHLILSTVRQALRWEAEHLHERTQPKAKVSPLQGGDHG